MSRKNQQRAIFKKAFNLFKTLIKSSFELQFADTRYQIPIKWPEIGFYPLDTVEPVFDQSDHTLMLLFKENGCVFASFFSNSNVAFSQ